jgi:pimeloyl-ACP methyl ester carboxylesterase
MPQETAPYAGRKRSPIWLWSKRIIGGTVALVVLAATVGLIEQAIFTAVSKRRYPAPGRLVDVAGHRMHINCMGKGSPTVILESGFGGYSLDWTLVQPEIAKFTRVCSYDRAGLGWSDARPEARTSKEIASELSSLLAAAEVGGPYLIVGHSAGGYHARIFVAQNRDRIAGVVLVDSSHPDQEIRSPESPASKRRFREFLRVGRITMFFGLPRWLGKCGRGGSNFLPRLQPVHAMSVARECRPELVSEIEAEVDGMDESRQEVRDSGTLGEIPLVVISRDPSQSDEQWKQMQRELTQLSSRGTQIIAKDSGHFIQVDRPDVVVDAIHGVLDEAGKKSQSLSYTH